MDDIYILIGQVVVALGITVLLIYALIKISEYISDKKASKIEERFNNRDITLTAKDRAYLWGYYEKLADRYKSEYMDERHEEFIRDFSEWLDIRAGLELDEEDCYLVKGLVRSKSNRTYPAICRQIISTKQRDNIHHYRETETGIYWIRNFDYEFHIVDFLDDKYKFDFEEIRNLDIKIHNPIREEGGIHYAIGEFIDGVKTVMWKKNDKWEQIISVSIKEFQRMLPLDRNDHDFKIIEGHLIDENGIQRKAKYLRDSLSGAKYKLELEVDGYWMNGIDYSFDDMK